MTISNVDESGDVYAPYAWSRQDAEALDLPDGSFDLAAVSAGLHHCASPHRALLEMLPRRAASACSRSRAATRC